jgi:hypothetical protein
MSKKKFLPLDAWFDRKMRIDPSDPTDLALWGLVLGVPGNEVLEASRIVGVEPEAVQAYLGRRQAGGEGSG